MSAHWDIPAILTTLFMMFVVLYWITRPNPLSAKSQLSRTQIAAVLVVLVGGLATFTVPLVHTDPAVMGRARWSALDVLSEMRSADFALSPTAIDVLASYALMLIAIVVLVLPPLRHALRIVSLLGIICSSWALEMGHYTLFKWFTPVEGALRHVQVSYGPAMYALPIVMSLVLLLSLEDVL